MVEYCRGQDRVMAMKVEKAYSGYRIVEIKNGRVYSLFHATNGSREIQVDAWNRCRDGLVNDGSHGTVYAAGWHFLKTKEDADSFFNRMFRIRTNRYVIRCLCFGNIREKNHSSKGHCWLADQIYISSRDVLEALRGG